MSDLRELYQEMILDHGRAPRNLRAIEDADHTAEGFNPLCGDRVKLYLRVAGGVVVDAGFEGSGCAISTASASMLTEVVVGKRVEEVDELRRRFRGLVTGEVRDASRLEELGKLAVFSGVCAFPNRIKCASLVWHALESALHSEAGAAPAVSTE